MEVALFRAIVHETALSKGLSKDVLRTVTGCLSGYIFSAKQDDSVEVN